MTCAGTSTSSLALSVPARSISVRTPKPCSARAARAAATVGANGRGTVTVIAYGMTISGLSRLLLGPVLLDRGPDLVHVEATNALDDLLEGRCGQRSGLVEDQDAVPE